MHQHHKHQQSSDFEFSLEVVFEIGPELDSECPMFSQTNVAAVKSIGQVLGHSEEGAQKFLELEEEISLPLFLMRIICEGRVISLEPRAKTKLP